MEDQPRPDRYATSPGNVESQYVDEEQTVLVNKLGICDLGALQAAEEEGLIKAYRTLLGEVRANTPMTCELLQHIHRQIFGDLYEWAGRWRSVQISKPGAIWPPPVYLDQAMQTFEKDVLQSHPAASLIDSDDTFCEAVGEIQGEFLAIHPFREGNARTIKLLTDLLAAQSGRRPLTYDTSELGRDRYISAAKAAMARKDYQPLVAIIRASIQSDRAP